MQWRKGVTRVGMELCGGKLGCSAAALLLCERREVPRAADDEKLDF